MNTTKYNSNVTGPSKTVRIHSENEDYHKASTLSSWLFMKYDMSYKTYSNKSKNRKNELRAEYVADTGNESPQAKDNIKRLICGMMIITSRKKMLMNYLQV